MSLFVLICLPKLLCSPWNAHPSSQSLYTLSGKFIVLVVIHSEIIDSQSHFPLPCFENSLFLFSEIQLISVLIEIPPPFEDVNLVEPLLENLPLLEEIKLIVDFQLERPVLLDLRHVVLPNGHHYLHPDNFDLLDGLCCQFLFPFFVLKISLNLLQSFAQDSISLCLSSFLTLHEQMEPCLQINLLAKQKVIAVNYLIMMSHPLIILRNFFPLLNHCLFLPILNLRQDINVKWSRLRIILLKNFEH